MNRENILKALSAVSLLGGRNVLLERGFVELHSDTCHMRCSCCYQGQHVVVPLDKLKQALFYCKAEEVDIHVKGNVLKVTANRYKRDIPIIPEYWVYSKTPESRMMSIQVNADELAAAFKSCMTAASLCEDRIDLQRLQMSPGVVFGTNGALMVMAGVESATGTMQGYNLSVPTKTASVIHNLSGDTVKVHYNDNVVRFTYGDNDWVESAQHAKKNDMVGIFRGILDRFESSEKAVATLQSSELSNAVLAASSASPTKIGLSIRSESFDVYTGGESGEFDFLSTLDASGLSGAGTINVNPTYVGRAIRACGGETVNVQIGEHLLLSSGSVKAMVCGMR